MTAPDRLCSHGTLAAACECCAARTAAAAALGLPDLAAGIGRSAQARHCGCCPLPIEPGEPTATTAGGETVHRSCAGIIR